MKIATIGFVVLMILIELDKKIYNKLDEDYKRFIYKENYEEHNSYYKSNGLTQFLYNIDKKTSKNKGYRWIGLIVLFLILFWFDKINKSYITLVGNFIFLFLIALSIYGLLNGLKKVNEYKQKHNKENVRYEKLSIIVQSLFFLIIVIYFYMV